MGSRFKALALSHVTLDVHICKSLCFCRAVSAIGWSLFALKHSGVILY
jgi:hypothetical protein